LACHLAPPDCPSLLPFVFSRVMPDDSGEADIPMSLDKRRRDAITLLRDLSRSTLSRLCFTTLGGGIDLRRLDRVSALLCTINGTFAFILSDQLRVGFRGVPDPSAPPRNGGVHPIPSASAALGLHTDRPLNLLAARREAPLVRFPKPLLSRVVDQLEVLKAHRQRHPQP
jgi:hypothetical protein